MCWKLTEASHEALNFEVANLEVPRKTRRKTSILKLHSVKIGGSLARNVRFSAPTCLVSSLWFSCGVAASMGEAARPILFEGFQAGCHVVLRGRRGTLWHSKLFDNVSKVPNWAEVSHKMLVFLRPRVSSRVSGEAAKPLLFGGFARQVWHFVTFQPVLYTPHPTLHTLHSQLPTLHSTLYTLHSTFHTLHFTLYTPHFTLYTLHSTLHTLHFTLLTPHSSLYTLHSTLHTLHTTLYTLHSTLYTLHCTLLTSHFTLHTLHFTLYTPHFTLYTVHNDVHFFISSGQLARHPPL